MMDFGTPVSIPGISEVPQPWRSALTGALAVGVIGVMLGYLATKTTIQIAPLFAGTVAFLVAARIAVWGYRRDLLFSPAVLTTVPLLVGFAASMVGGTQIYRSWGLGDIAAAASIAVAPLFGVLLARAVGCRHMPPRERQLTILRPGLMVGCVVVLLSIGTVVLFIEYRSLGGPPLLGSSIDATRLKLRENGALHTFTEGVTLALLLAAWARCAAPESFSILQRRILNAVLFIGPILLISQGGRLPVLGGLVSAGVVGLRYQPRRLRLRLSLWALAGLLAFSGLLFIERASHGKSSTLSSSVLFDPSARARSPFQAISVGTLYSLGEHQRTVLEFRHSNVELPAFTTSAWFLHTFDREAIDPEDIALGVTNLWVTSTYAGPTIMDLGLVPALFLGVGIGAIGQFLYRGFASGKSVVLLWIYAYLAAPLTMLFYLNMVLYFPHVWLDLVTLTLLGALGVGRIRPRVGP